MRSNSLATSRAKTQSVGNSSTAPLSDPAGHLPSLALNVLSLSFLLMVGSLICPISLYSEAFPNTPTPHSTTSSTILLYFILRELEVRGDGSGSVTHMSRKICREAKGMILWRQILRMTIPSSSSDYKAYEDAAEEFHPYIPFFATFDSKVLFPVAILGPPTLLSCLQASLPKLMGSWSHSTCWYSPPQTHPFLLL